MRAVDTGRDAEDRACRYLQTHGLVLVQRNYRSRRGEIDLVMRHADSLVFVEVRYRRRTDYGGAAESIDRYKQQRLAACALHYLQSHPAQAHGSCRFDVITIEGPDNRIDWIRNAIAIGG